MEKSFRLPALWIPCQHPRETPISLGHWPKSIKKCQFQSQPHDSDGTCPSICHHMTWILLSQASHEASSTPTALPWLFAATVKHFQWMKNLCASAEKAHVLAICDQFPVLIPMIGILMLDASKYIQGIHKSYITIYNIRAAIRAYSTLTIQPKSLRHQPTGILAALLCFHGPLRSLCSTSRLHPGPKPGSWLGMMF